MRILLLLILASISFVTLDAQTQLPLSVANYGLADQFSQRRNVLGDSSNAHKKWFTSTYVGMATGIGFSSGGRTSFLTVPIGLQLNRRLTDNLYAFGVVAAAPSYFNFNRPLNNKNFPQNTVFNGNSFGMQSSISAGLMYVNDAKTFSISGSIGIGRTDYPFSPSNRPTPTQHLSTGTRQ